MQTKSILMLHLASLVVAEAWVSTSPPPSLCHRKSATSAAVKSHRNAMLMPQPQQLLFKQGKSSSSSSLNMVESIALGSESSLLFGITDHEQVGQEMAESVQRWLDAEWMPQDIHGKMGQSCKRSYVKCRSELKTDDLMAIMMQVAEDLQVDWNREYNADAFVNAWDVANYVSDYLTAKSGIQGCECNAKIH
jgi:hypothetical protein